MPLPPLPPKARGPVDMSEPSRRELVIEAHRTFGEGPARELAGHLRVPFGDCLGAETRQDRSEQR